MNLKLWSICLFIALAYVSAAPSNIQEHHGGGAIFDIFLHPGKHFTYQSDTFKGISDRMGPMME